MVMFCISVVLLNFTVTTRQGKNYEIKVIKMPLYLKLLDFFDRHYNYGFLVKRIVGNSKNKKEAVLKIFEWTNDNLKRSPSGLPSVDDHVWHIIVRGYGEADQFSDVFTTLCNYSGVEAFFNYIQDEARTSRIVLSFVRINDKWIVFDPYFGVYFINKSGALADIRELLAGNWVMVSISDAKIPERNYSNYFSNLKIVKPAGLVRPNIQSPLNRLEYEIKKWVSPR